MTKKYDAHQQKVEYSGQRCVWRDGDLVYKTDPIRLNANWRKQMDEILKVCQIPGFSHFIDNGYATHFINGSDLHGNLPFEMDGSALTCVLPSEKRYEVCGIFEQARITGCSLGYTLGDITCGNIMTDKQGLYLIDYEVIVPYPLTNDYINIWNNTLKIVFGDI